MESLKGKVVVITGSTRGIGRAVAEAVGRAGAKLVICSRNDSRVSEVANSLKAKGYYVSGIPIDVSREEDLKRLFAHSISTWGRIDIWINNAGVSSGYRLLEDISSEEINQIVNINLTAILLGCKIILPYFKEQNRGILINMSGRGGDGDYAPYMVPYTATKSAVTTLTRGLAKENADYDISINSVVPGMVKTDFYKDIKTSAEGKDSLESLPFVLNAFGVPLEVVGDFIAELASREPGKITGKNYSLLKGFRLFRGIILMIWYRIRGKV